MFTLRPCPRRVPESPVARRRRGRVPAVHNEPATTPQGFLASGPSGETLFGLAAALQMLAIAPLCLRFACPEHGCMRLGGEVSVDGCHGHGSQCWSIATFREHGYSIRIRTNASRHDSKQEPYAVAPHVRICAGGVERSSSQPRPAHRSLGSLKPALRASKRTGLLTVTARQGMQGRSSDPFWPAQNDVSPP